MTDTSEATGTDVRMIDHRLDGKPFSGASERTGPVYNPATGRTQARVRLAAAADVDEIVASSVAAAAAWRTSSLATRQRVMFAARQLLVARLDEIGAVVTSEHGKVLADAEGEVQRGLEADFACASRTCSRAGSARASRPGSTSTRSGSRASSW
jgi:malonate-semialdehyde dehydrogenase (acetylating)/methylmalonate-semialdehyde dehydrogenase